jgi:ABC-type Fe3+-hydroxamate transport system substrate-binding protein
VPSATESVFALGAGDRLVGVTRYCVRPPEAKLRASVVGGTKSPRLDAIRDLKPDLILANQEENREDDVNELDEVAPVYVAFPRDLSSAFTELDNLAMMLDCREVGQEVLDELEQFRERLLEESRARSRFRFLYLIWRNPFMAAGRETFIDAFFQEAGGQNVVDAEAGRYPKLTASDIEALRPDAVLLSSEPFPFESRHTSELLDALSDRGILEGRTFLVDGELLSWHGVRLREGIPYLSRLARQIVALGNPPD